LNFSKFSLKTNNNAYADFRRSNVCVDVEIFLHIDCIIGI